MKMEAENASIFSKVLYMENKDLYDRLSKLSESGIVPLHMPGHKRNTDIFSMSNPYGIDITEIDGFDNLHNADGIIKEDFKRAAKLFGADETLFLVNGSSAGNMAAICGASKKGDTVIVARNVHCSVNNALFLNELNPVYIYPEIDEIGICTGITRESVRAALEEHPETCEVIITSPTYEGVVSDIKGIAEETHRFGAVLIVDEAHGAHFNFHDKFPESAVKCGADAVIQSIHKTLPSFTQTALLHLNGNLIDKDRVKKYWNIYQSTSPSYILMAGISRCLTFLEDNMCDSVSSGYMDEYVFRLTNLRKEIKKLKYIKLQEVDDISKIVLVVNDGKNLYDKLLNDYGIQLEMASVNYCIAMTSVGDKQVYYDRFIEALRELDTPENEYSGSYSPALVKAVVALNMYEADSCDNETVNICDSIGHIAASNICFYPPGINLVNAGEIVTQEVIDVIKDGLGHGLSAIGVEKAADGSTLIKCVKQRTVL